MPNFRGEFFLHKRNSSLQASEEVSSTQKRLEQRGVEVDQKPAGKISRYLERLVAIVQPTDNLGRIRTLSQERNIKLLENELFGRVIILKDEIPENYWETQRRLAREQGHGDIYFSEQMKEAHADVIRRDQKTSLHRWVQYFSSPDSNVMPSWVKYWAFSSVLKLGKYDVQSKKFSHRDSETVAPFAEINREALALASGAITSSVQDELPAEWNPVLKRLAKQGSFGPLYAYFLDEVRGAPEQLLKNTTGSWKKYPQHSDAKALSDSLYGFSTGWCTADYGTAEAQLRGGDFYVYYSQDANGEDTKPRVAVRMQGNSKIEEVRGIAEGQNLDPYIAPVVEEKMSEFGHEGELYKKRARHMKMISEIERKQKVNEQITKDEARLLWELDERVEGFGYDEDPRLEELRSQRDFKHDLATAYDTTPDHVSINSWGHGRDSNDHIFSEGVVYHHGNLEIDVDSHPDYPQFVPQIIGGDFVVRGWKDITNLKMPKEVNGELQLDDVESLNHVTLPSKYNGIRCYKLKELNDVMFYPEAKGSFHFSSLNSMRNVTFPQEASNVFIRAEVVESVQFPQVVQNSFIIEGITNLPHCLLPQKVGSLHFLDVQSLDGVKLPSEVDKDIILTNLQTAKGLELPASFAGTLHLHYLSHSEGLVLPEKLENLWLDSLESAEGLILPYEINGTLNLRSLKNAKGIVFPFSVFGETNMPNLETLEGLTFHRDLKREDQEPGKFVPDQYYTEIDIGTKMGYSARDAFVKSYDHTEIYFKHSENWITIQKREGKW